MDDDKTIDRPDLPEWVLHIREAAQEKRCVRMGEPEVWGTGNALALAPHPDDPDAVAVTLKLLERNGWNLYWAILTSGWSGVPDHCCGRERDAKALVRTSEQIASARLFGLPEERLLFLGLSENNAGDLAWTDRNYEKFNSLLGDIDPSVVILPHGNDSNATHRMVYEWFAEWAEEWNSPVLGLGNEDPKSQHFSPNTEALFGEQEAHWKGSLLECHRTQSLRNQATRGMTFAERILGMNHRAAADEGSYSERFEAAFWGIR